MAKYLLMTFIMNMITIMVVLLFLFCQTLLFPGKCYHYQCLLPWSSYTYHADMGQNCIPKSNIFGTFQSVCRSVFRFFRWFSWCVVLKARKKSWHGWNVRNMREEACGLHWRRSSRGMMPVWWVQSDFWGSCKRSVRVSWKFHLRKKKRSLSDFSVVSCMISDVIFQ